MDRNSGTWTRRRNAYNPEMNEITLPWRSCTPFFTMVQGRCGQLMVPSVRVIGHEISTRSMRPRPAVDGEGSNWWSTPITRLDRTRAGSDRAVRCGTPYERRARSGRTSRDVSDLAVAYRAYVRFAGGEPASSSDGPVSSALLSSDSRLARTRPEETVRRITIRSAFTAGNRVFGTLLNIDVLRGAFDVQQPGDGMWRDPATVRIWQVVDPEEPRSVPPVEPCRSRLTTR